MHPRKFQSGRIYDHPEQGHIRLDNGAWTVDGRLSNHWHWTVLATGAEGYGYGFDMKDVTDQYVLVHRSALVPLRHA